MSRFLIVPSNLFYLITKTKPNLTTSPPPFMSIPPTSNSLPKHYFFFYFAERAAGCLCMRESSCNLHSGRSRLRPTVGGERSSLPAKEAMPDSQSTGDRALDGQPGKKPDRGTNSAGTGERGVAAGLQMACKACLTREASVLLLPCRHLCLCAQCDPAVLACPVCNSSKNASIQVFMV